MKNESFIFFAITYEINNFLNNDFRKKKKKKRILLNETTLRTLPFLKVSLKSSGLSISEKILCCNVQNITFNSIATPIFSS